MLKGNKKSYCILNCRTSGMLNVYYLFYHLLSQSHVTKGFFLYQLIWSVAIIHDSLYLSNIVNHTFNFAGSFKTYTMANL